MEDDLPTKLRKRAQEQEARHDPGAAAAFDSAVDLLDADPLYKAAKLMVPLLRTANEFWYDSSKSMGAVTAEGGTARLDRFWHKQVTDILDALPKSDAGTPHEFHVIATHSVLLDAICPSCGTPAGNYMECKGGWPPAQGAWMLLSCGHRAIFDDYMRPRNPEPGEHPTPEQDAFLLRLEGAIRSPGFVWVGIDRRNKEWRKQSTSTSPQVIPKIGDKWIYPRTREMYTVIKVFRGRLHPSVLGRVMGLRSEQCLEALMVTSESRGGTLTTPLSCRLDWNHQGDHQFESLPGERLP